MDERQELDELRARHAELERALQSEADKPFPDQAKIVDLKKKKLQAKDRMAALEGG